MPTSSTSRRSAKTRRGPRRSGRILRRNVSSFDGQRLGGRSGRGGAHGGDQRSDLLSVLIAGDSRHRALGSVRQLGFAAGHDRGAGSEFRDLLCHCCHAAADRESYACAMPGVPGEHACWSNVGRAIKTDYISSLIERVRSLREGRVHAYSRTAGGHGRAVAVCQCRRIAVDPGVGGVRALI